MGFIRGMKTKAEVYHEIRNGDRIFLCIARPGDMVESAKMAYAVEREITANDTPESIRALIAQMESESGLSLSPSAILRTELGIA